MKVPMRSVTVLAASVIGASILAAPASASSSKPTASPEVLAVGTNEVAAQGKWHRLWGPAFVWPNSRFPGAWASKPFKSKSKVLGINFRCWRWRGAGKAWLGITGTDGYLRAKTPYALCDGQWKTVHWKRARKGVKYRVTLHNFPAVKAPWEIKAYNYW
ncbi:hypothetical protein GCM10010411_77630 [Actinomadura fulvescens]|uniref:Secreted protein n=1 Tax=Actinomadura fulvescens TaxID=46160 RepID=A0ABP6CZB2_9ACTN